MDRVKKLARLIDLQEKMHRLAEWRLAAIDRKQDELAENRARLFETLNAGEPLHGLFIESMARRLNEIAREADRLNREREEQHQRLLEEGLRLKRYERMGEKARGEYMERDRKRGFQALLDAIGGRDDASLT
jgi:hypothetical protein